MPNIETVQDWIEGFERYVSFRFQKKLTIVALEEGRLMNIESVCKIVESDTGITVDQMKGGNRSRHVVAARHITMYLAYKYTNLTFKAIGKFFNRDHTTAIHARTVVENMIDINDLFVVPVLNRCEAIINSLLNQAHE